MKNRLFIYCVILIALLPLSCLAQTGSNYYGTFEGGLYEGKSLNGQYDNDDNHALFAATSEPSAATFKSDWTGGTVTTPYDGQEAKLFQPFERQNEGGTGDDEFPEGEATDEIPVGNGMIIIFMFLMFLVGVRMGRKDTNNDTTIK